MIKKLDDYTKVKKYLDNYIKNNRAGMLVVCTGPQRGGKTYLCKDLKKSNGGVCVDFKDSLIKMASHFSNDIIDDYEGFKTRVVGVKSKLVSDIILSIFPSMLTGRTILRILGTEIIRNIDKDFWIKEYKKEIIKIATNDPIYTADMRFINEFSYLQKHSLNLVVVICNRDNHYTEAHTSEKMSAELVKKYGHKYTIITGKDVDKLYRYAAEKING